MDYSKMSQTIISQVTSKYTLSKLLCINEMEKFNESRAVEFKF